MKKTYLSKSKLMNFRQCPKRLYLEVHRPELAEVSEAMEQIFATGHQVGEIARQQHPGGILIGHDQELAQALRDTKETLAKQPDKPLFEATFQHDGVLIRADLLLPGGNGHDHNLVEVKSSTEVKPHYLADCTIQTWVTENAGYPLGRIELAHIDNSFVYPGGGDYRGLLRHADITTEVRSLLSQVPIWVEEARRTLEGTEPAIAVGKQCKKPYECPFIEYCSPPLATEYPVTTLFNDKGKKAASSLLAKGIDDIRHIPPGWPLNETHERQRRVVASGKAELNPEAGRILRALLYPRYYIDFETIQPAVPIWPGTRPFQKQPYQWSCHIETADGNLQHREFLDVSGNPPMRGSAENLIQATACEGEGPIFAYHKSFEAGRLQELGETFPDLALALDRIVERLVDLEPIAQKNYYHPAMMGSWSLKTVLPAIAPELNYANLDHVQDGGMAETAYMEILNPNTGPERREELIRGLREYCRQDTLGLVKIAHYFMGDQI